MKKRVLAIVLSFVMILQLAPLPEGWLSGVFDFAITSQAATMSGNVNDSITWTLTEVTPNGSLSESDKAYKLTLKGTGKMPDYSVETYAKPNGYSESRTTAPWKESALGIQDVVIGSGITNVPKNAFYHCTALTTVSIPESVETIGYQSFELCSSLTKVQLPSKLKTIESDAFYSCTDMESVNIPKSVTSIGSAAFQYCSALTSIEFPANSTLKSVPSNVFRGCGSLKSVTISEGIEKIGMQSFYDCSALENVKFPSTLTEIGYGAFWGCSSYSADTGLERVDLSGTKVSSIGGSAFYECKRMKSIQYPKNTLKSIGEDAFGDTAMEELIIPASVKEITGNPYTEGELKKITIESGNSDYIVKNGMLIRMEQIGTEKQMYRVICYPCNAENMNVTVPSPVQEIGKSAFYRVPLTGVTLPPSLRIIDDSAFYGCRYLTSIKVPGNVTKIGYSAFRNCTNLSDITLGADLLILGDYAFSGCSALTGVQLPDKLTNIGDSVFSNCEKLVSIELPNSLKTIGSSVFSNCSSLISVEIGQNLTDINGGVFVGCSKLGEIKISKNNSYILSEDNIVYTIDKKKLIYYAAALPDDKFLIPDTVETVGSCAFAYAEELKELRVPETVKKLEEYAVYYNAQLSKILFYGDAPEISTDDFYASQTYNTSLKKYLYTYNVYNTSIYKNKTGKDKKTYDNDGLVIFTRDGKMGFEEGWKTKPSMYENSATCTYKWINKVLFSTWDPDKTDKADGTFGNLKWSYRDDIGELSFTGSGKTDNYTEAKLPTWAEDGADHRMDIKLVDTTGATSVELGDYAFYGATGVLRLNAGKELAKIGSHTFAGCTSMKVLAIQNTPEIGESAFEGNISLKDEVDLRGTKNIAKASFKDCVSLTGVIFGNNLKTLGEAAFSNCAAMESLTLTEKVESLSKQCFYGCKSLRTVNIPKSVTTIGDSCFDQCSGLKKIYFYGNYPKEFSYNALDNCHEDLVIYYRSGNDTWVNNPNIVEHKWNGIPVQEQNKFYTEKQDHYSFANTQSSFGYGGYYRIPRQRYVTALQSTVRGSYYYAWTKEWSGNCFGMASSTTEFYDGDRFNVADYTQGATSLYDVKAPGNSEADLTKIIEIYQVSQFAEKISDEIGNNYGKYKKIVKSVEEFERSGGLSVDEEADPLVLCVYSDYVGHALVPVSVDINDDGDYIMQVYDCNNPGEFSELKVKGDFSGIEYKTLFITYKTASFVKYSTIRETLENADFTGEGFQKPAKASKSATKESTKVTVAINREDVTVANTTGKDYTEIKGAYEQRTMSGAKEDVFSGVRSFVLPEGEYDVKALDEKKQKTAATGSSEESDLVYYVATEDMYSEVTTTDEEAELTVKSVEGKGYDVITLKSNNADTESELTVMNEEGKEATISVKGNADLRAEVTEDNKVDVTLAGNYSAVTINDEPVNVENGKVADIEFKEAKAETPAPTPTVKPTVKPTEAPTPTVKPTVKPTEAPTPTVKPTATAIVTEDPNVPKSTPFVTTLPIPTTEVSTKPEVTKTPATTEPTKKPETPTKEPEATKVPEASAPAATTAPTMKPEVDEEDVDYEVAVYNTNKKLKKGSVVSAPSGKYMITKNTGSRTVAYYGLKKKSTEKVVIPRRIKVGKKYYKVTTIRAGAFKNATALKAVFIGNNVTTIGTNAFKNCKKLMFVRIGKKVTKIGSGAFRGCKKLDGLRILSDKLKTVGSNSFKGVSSDIVVKTSTDKCKEYKQLLIKKGNMPNTASFVGELVAIYYGGKRY